MYASTFKDYHGGVFSGCPYDENIGNNHAVQLVGYGSDFSPAGVVDYWLVRNSWGTSFGEDGYIRILREATPQCGTDSTTSGHVCQVNPSPHSFPPERARLHRPPPRVRHVWDAP